jgi:hypothetical protein
MLYLYDKVTKNKYCSFVDLNEMFISFNDLEKDKLLNADKDSIKNIIEEDGAWGFNYYSKDRIKLLYESTKDNYIKDSIREAYLHNEGAHEIYSGDWNNPIYIIDSQNIDISKEKKQWLKKYCDYYEMFVLETPIQRMVA